ncbi:hypothetical protein LNV09_00430 [Paucibacter sp. B2R-40]|uniref:hypothetical protein n=1 Tax=Paucibacter sp. B2R-40 TaxID=2893554 RepID=UPI0021E3EEFB|nr:hypothetical protein [Paucibacter sp. B2R-40]MCV2352619.1 hypothetical protein [Paucibacter sp. B2R-40]
MTVSKILKDPYPSRELWSSRTDYFSWAMGEALGEGTGVSTNHSRVLELELETVFCAGAWYATIVFACAAVEVYVNGQDEKREAKFLEKFELRDDWIWLTNRRKYIVHPSQHSPADPTAMSYQQPELEEEAKRAVRIALKVLLLGTRENLPTSLHIGA